MAQLIHYGLVFLVGIIAGYAFRGKVHAAVVDAGAAIKKDVGTAASDIAKKV